MRFTGTAVCETDLAASFKALGPLGWEDGSTEFLTCSKQKVERATEKPKQRQPFHTRLPNPKRGFGMSETFAPRPLEVHLGMGGGGAALKRERRPTFR